MGRMFKFKYFNKLGIKSAVYVFKEYGIKAFIKKIFETFFKKKEIINFNYLEWLKANGYNSSKLVKAKSILLASHDLTLSGAPFLLYYLAKELKKEGYFVTVISPTKGDLQEKYKEINVPVVIDPVFASFDFMRFESFLSKFDVIFVNTITMYSTVIFGKKFGVPVVWLIHEAGFGYELAKKHPLTAKALTLADYVLFYHEKTAKLYETFKIKKLVLIKFGARALEKIKITNKSDKLKICHIGSIEARKGQDILVESFLKLSEEVRNKVEIFFIGRTLEVDYLNRLKKETELFNNIHWVGEIPQETVNEFLNKSEIYVCSSRDETGPLTVLEAMSCEKAVISTDVGEVSQMIDNWDDGVIIPINDVDKLTSAIEKLFKDRNLLSKLGKNGYIKFKKKFTINNFTSSIIEIIKTLIK